jgi:hypothetical protein
MFEDIGDSRKFSKILKTEIVGNRNKGRPFCPAMQVRSWTSQALKYCDSGSGHFGTVSKKNVKKTTLWGEIFRKENPSVWQITMFSQICPMRNMGIDYVRNICKKKVYFCLTIPQIWPTLFFSNVSEIHYILESSHQQAVAEHTGICHPNTEIFHSL